VAEFRLTSSAFAHGEAIPARHSCDGENVSPPLSWSGLPDGTRSLALIVDDPDAPVGIFTHWLAWGIDPEAGGLAEGEAAPVEGRNDFGVIGYAPLSAAGTGPTATSSDCTRSTQRSGFAPGRTGRSLSEPSRGACLVSPSSSASTSDSHPRTVELPHS
jgi:hypothetical protein